MKYEIIRNRGVLKDGAPFIISQGKPLMLEFNGITGDFLLCLKRTDSADKEIVLKGKEKVTVPLSNIKAGIYNVELKKVEHGLIKDVIVCTPIACHTLATMSTGLMCYPQMDEVIHRLLELEKEVAVLTDWKNEVEPKIHEHKIMK